MLTGMGLCSPYQLPKGNVHGKLLFNYSLGQESVQVSCEEGRTPFRQLPRGILVAKSHFGGVNGYLLGKKSWLPALRQRELSKTPG